MTEPIVPEQSLAIYQHARKAIRTQPQRIDKFDSCMQVMQMRRNGMSYEAIAEELHISPKNAYDAVKYLLDAGVKESSDHIRQIEAFRLDRLMLAYFERAENGDMKATELVLKLMDHRAKILGLAKPEEMNVTATMIFKEKDHDTI